MPVADIAAFKLLKPETVDALAALVTDECPMLVALIAE